MDRGGHSHHFTLELVADPQAVRGILEHANGTREPFWGWLELMAALERAGLPRGGGDGALIPSDEGDPSP